MTPRQRHAYVAWWLVGCLSLVYIPDIGKGFIKDDYGWIASSHVDTVRDIGRLFTTTPMGFYRPLVSLSFAASEPIFGARALPYAHINFGLIILIAAGVWGLARRLGLSNAAALFAAAVWAFNFHGISMSVLWISGRTSLLGALGAVLAGWAFASSRFILAATLLFVALLAKEEPLLLPVVFALWLWFDARHLTARQTLSCGLLTRALAPSAVAVAAYLAFRSRTDAFTPANAPDFYRFSASAIAGNVAEYLDRSLTFPVALLLLGALGLSWRTVRVLPGERAIVAKGLTWLACGFALTVMVPVRSSLYVCLPTIGSAIAAAALASAWWRATRRPALTMTAALVLPLALLPVYWARNARMKNEALLASHTLATIAERLATVPATTRIIIVSPPTDRPSIADAFGEGIQPAVRLMIPAAAQVEVVALPAATAPSANEAAYRVEGTEIKLQKD